MKPAEYIQKVAVSDVSNTAPVRVDNSYLRAPLTELFFVSNDPSRMATKDIEICLSNTDEWAASQPTIMTASVAMRGEQKTIRFILNKLPMPASYVRGTVYRTVWIHPSQMACSFSEFNCNTCPYVLLCQLGKIPIALLASMEFTYAVHRNIEHGSEMYHTPNVVDNTLEIQNGMIYTPGFQYNRLDSYSKPHAWKTFKQRSILTTLVMTLYASPGMFERHPVILATLKARKQNENNKWIE